MKCFFVACIVLLAPIAMIAPTHAAGTGCLPAPLPTTATPPVFSRNVQRGFDQMHFDVWRQSCPSGGSIVLLRVTFTTVPFLCYLDFALVQGASQFKIRLTDSAETLGFCGSLFVGRTFYLAPEPGMPAYDPPQAFTLLFDTVTQTPRFAALEVAAAGPTPPIITVVATGCTTCRPGNLVGFEAHITNPGAAMRVQIKGGVRFPDGSIVGLLGHDHEEVVQPGSFTLTLVPLMPLPGGLPVGDAVIEAAILEPELGVTLSRDSVTAHSLP